MEATHSSDYEGTKEWENLLFSIVYFIFSDKWRDTCCKKCILLILFFLTFFLGFTLSLLWVWDYKKIYSVYIPWCHLFLCIYRSSCVFCCYFQKKESWIHHFPANCHLHSNFSWLLLHQNSSKWFIFAPFSNGDEEIEQKLEFMRMNRCQSWKRGE